jgi:glycosyltransferase involved in cell wall biosynthesis
MLERLSIHRLVIAPEDNDHRPTPWLRIHGKFLGLCRSVYDAVRLRPDLKPDLVVAHGGRGAPTVFLPELLDCPIVNYCEYFFARDHSDISYRLDLPAREARDVVPFFPRCINASTLVALANADAGYSATHWQRQTFPEHLQPKIEVHFDGIDTDLYRPREGTRVIEGQTITNETRVVTFVARGLESIRGFDVFLKVASRIARERSDILFVVVGTEQIYYGWDGLFTGNASFKEWALARIPHDSSRFLFLGHLEPERLAEVLGMSDLHLYLTVPFVLSWSALNAMACGCVVLASDVAPVREVIIPGETGLLEPFFDVDRLADVALRVLAEPAAYRVIGKKARALIEERYSLEVAIPDLKDYFERMAVAGVRRCPPEPARVTR